MAAETTNKKAMISSLDLISKKDGEYRRKDSTLNEIIEKNGKFTPEANRYSLYIAHACPWANRCHTVINFKGLQDCIEVFIVHPTWQRTKPEVDGDEHVGWVFSSEDEKIISIGGGRSLNAKEHGFDVKSDPRFKSIRELYEFGAPDYDAPPVVPVLFDKKTNMIVNNESSQIIVMLNSNFNEFARHPEVELNPKHLQEKRNKIDDWVYNQFNNGVYRTGFAKKQEAYEKAHAEVYDALAKMNTILGENRYLTGDVFTLTDIRAFMTIIRFDEVYSIYFKCSSGNIRDFPNVFEYAKELYQMPQIRETIHMKDIKYHYYTSHASYNAFSVVPVGRNMIEAFSQPHNRDQM